MAFIQTENTNLGKFWKVLQWKMLEYFMDIWYILRPFGFYLWTFGICYGHLVIIYGHLVYFVVIWSTFSRFCMLYQEKYGNPGSDVN
jgi:hypothetical protein